MRNKRHNSSLQYRLLVMYMISALLFLMSTQLHIHSKEAAASADHGAAVSVSSLINDVIQVKTGDQININPDGILKSKPVNTGIPLLFLLVTLLLFDTQQNCWRCRLSRTRHILPATADYGTPLLRGPPK